MKENRTEIDSWKAGEFIIEKGIWADTVLEHMPRDTMMKQPVTIGRDKDGLVVEWHYTGVIFTLARASALDATFGKITAYGVQKIEEVVYD
jgi:hypothetical protein